MADDPRKHHPEFTPSESPTRGKRVMGVRIPPLKPPPEPEPELEEPPMSPKPEPIHVERGETQGPPHDPWVQRIAALTLLVGAVAGAGWGGAKMTERDVPSSKQADKMTAAMGKLTAEMKAGQAHEKMQDQLLSDQAAKIKELESKDKVKGRQILLHAHVIHLLNGRVSPVWGWPEHVSTHWQSGTDNLHRHNRIGGQYPGTEETD